MENLSIFGNNTSDASTEETELLYSYGERVFLGICWIFIIILGTFGNSLVIIAVLVSRKLQTSTNVSVVSLAVADLLTSLFMIWSVFALLGHNGWPLPNAEWLCVMGGFMLYACGGVSMWHLAAISLNRLLQIRLPLPRYRMIYKPRNLAIMVAIVWLTPFTICLALPLAGIGGFGYDRQHSTCSDLDQHPQVETFHLAETAIFYPIPLITIITCYACICLRVRRHFKRQRSHENTMPSTDSPTVTRAMPMSEVSTAMTSVPSSTQDSDAAIVKRVPTNRVHRINKTEMDITKNLFLVVCVFFLFLSPYFIALFIPSSDYFLLYGGTIVLANSTINPVIYARRHPHFKVIFGCLLKRRYEAIPEPSKFLRHFLRVVIGGSTITYEK